MNLLEDAIDFDVYLISDYPECLKIVDQLFNEISELITLKKPSRSKETLKLVLINLFISFVEDKPIKYSRCKNSYLDHRRYGKLHFKYERIIPIIDTLKQLGYIWNKTGFQDREKHIARLSRMGPTQKLIDLIQDIPPADSRVIQKSQPQEIVQLKNEEKILMDYKDTRSVRDMRTNLGRYNRFIADQQIEVRVPSDVMISTRFLNKLGLSLLKGIVDITELEFVDFDLWYNQSPPVRLMDQGLMEFLLTLPRMDQCYQMYLNDGIILSSLPGISNDQVLNNRYVDYTNNDYRDILYRNNHIFLYSIYTMTKGFLKKISYFNNNNSDLQEFKSADFGINCLHFAIHYPYLHRVFNNESFKSGGRFYGAFHLELPKELRRHIYLNGEPTVELDFSALHIRMLYHREGIDYQTDPYQDVCDTKEERSIYKQVLLVAINADSEKSAIQAIRDRLRKKNLEVGLTDAEILYRLNKFKEVHPRIAHYLNTGIGLRLQNLDSRITDIVLKRMTQSGIPCLPVHDSYIVPQSHRNLLFQEMTKAYQTVMKGLSPVIK